MMKRICLWLFLILADGAVMAETPIAKSGAGRIPKIIHYCWLGSPTVPDFAQKVIQTWQKHMPDWQIRRCDEKTCDVDAIAWTREAYHREKAYNYTSDYCRLKALYVEGGLYLDTDHFLTKPVDELLTADLVMTRQDLYTLSGSFIAVTPRHPFIKNLMTFYESRPKFEFVSNPSVLIDHFRKSFPDFLSGIYLYQKGTEAVVYPPNMLMFDFGGEETHAVHMYAAGEPRVNVNHSAYYDLFKSYFIADEGLSLTKGDRVTHLIPTLAPDIFHEEGKAAPVKVIHQADGSLVTCRENSCAIWQAGKKKRSWIFLQSYP